MIFLGTGASEAIPNPLCDCEVCRKALRSTDPREKRARSAFSIDEENLIDFGPDALFAAARFGISLVPLKNLFYTHFHDDHFSLVNLDCLRMSRTPHPFRVYLSEPAMAGLLKFRDMMLSDDPVDFGKKAAFYEEYIEFISVRPYEPFAAGDMDVSALKTIHPGRFHGETALNYVFERNGKRFLYASDTGLYGEENYEFLKGKALNTLIMECSFGAQHLEPGAKHLTCESIEKMVNRFRQDGVVTDATEIYLTHIGHKGGLNHLELRQRMRDALGPQIDVAYDGLQLADF